MNVSSTSLPQLLYLGDVPVEASYHGSALIYRLLQGYPAERLCVVETNLHRSVPERRLPGVRYYVLSVGRSRWLYTRFHALVSSWFTLKASGLRRQVPSLIGKFVPEAVLTVAHGYSWLTAAAFARQHRLPLHLIVHDDWPREVPLLPNMKPWLERKFGEVYRQAASRFCVSPFMVEEYQQRYEAGATLLYPSRDPNTPVFDPVCGDRFRHHRAFTVAYAGSLDVGDYVRQLVLLSELLAGLGGNLLLHGPFDESILKSAGMNMSNVTVGGLLPSAELVYRLHQNADLLFLPMPFGTANSIPGALAFPSKLADYTATGLPLLIWGPNESSAAKWAANIPGVAAVVSNPDPGEMKFILQKLMLQPEWRSDLGKQAVRVGKQLFSSDSATKLFLLSLSGASRPPGST